MSNTVFRALVAILALGWAIAIASMIGPGFDLGTLWVVGFFLALTLSLGLIRGMPVREPGDERSHLEKLVESKPGMIVYALFSLVLVVGAGSVVGVIICLPVKGVVDTITDFPAILGTAIAGALMSMIGFGLFTLVLCMLGPILSAVYEAWIGYIAPMVA